MQKQPQSQGADAGVHQLKMLISWLLMISTLLLVHQAWAVERKVFVLAQMFEGMGDQLPGITRIFLAWFRIFHLAALLSLAAWIASIFTRFSHTRWAIPTVGVALASGLAYQAWATEALFAPILEMGRVMGGR